MTLTRVAEIEIRRPGEPSRLVYFREGTLGIGRHASNQVVLGDDAVSRWHAALFEEDGGFRLRDLGSRHGTRVGARRIQSHALGDGQTFSVGPYELRFSMQSGPRDAEPALVLVEDPEAEEEPVEPRPLEREIDWVAPGGAGASTRAASAFPRLLDAILRISSRLEPDELLRTLLDEVSQMSSPSEALVGVLRDDGAVEVRARRRSEAVKSPRRLSVSRSLLARAVRDARPLFLGSLAEAGAHPSASVNALGIRAAVCVPLVVGDRVEAVFYADWRADSGDPTLPELEWIAAVTLSARTAFENSVRFRRLREGYDRLARERRLATRLVGISAAFRDLLEVVDRCAELDVDVVVTGETGTGKELIARRLHERSRRAAGPFVAINCAAIPPDLFESEVFGHARGAFTGASDSRSGWFAEADGGTLFLDEIGDLAPGHQAKILRVIEERMVTPVGGRPRAVDVRVVAATNRDLRQEVAAGRMRPDLRQRLGVPIETTPLRTRREDIPCLAYHALDRLVAATGKPVRALSTDTLECLLSYDWPGNARELNACLRNALLFCGDTIEPRDLRLTAEIAAASPEALPSLADVEREHVARVLEATRGNQSRAARILGINEETVRTKMDRYGLKRESYRES